MFETQAEVEIHVAYQLRQQTLEAFLIWADRNTEAATAVKYDEWFRYVAYYN